MSTDTNNVDTPEVVTIAIPAIFTVHGARDDSATFDASKYTPEALQEFINQAVKVLCQRASASVEGVDKKRKAEKEKLEQIVNGEYKAGARRSAEPVSVEGRAELQLLMRKMGEVFPSATTEAKQKKLARQDDPWFHYFMQAISVKTNREDVTHEEVRVKMVEYKDALAAMIETEIEAVKAEDARIAKNAENVDKSSLL